MPPISSFAEGVLEAAGIEKEALFDRLARLALTDVPKTPRLLMRQRSPSELAQVQHGIASGFARMQAPVKAAIEPALQKLPGKAQHYARKGVHTLIENPDGALAWGTGIPGALSAYVGGKKLLEKGIDRLAPAAKLAAGAPTRGNFMMASDMPAFRPPRLDQAIQKNSGGTSMPVTDLQPKPAPVADKPGANPSLESSDKYAAGKLVKLMGDARIEVDKKGKGLGKGPLNKGADFLPDFAVYQPGVDSFKRSKYAMPVQELSAFVDGLLKEGMGGITPAGHLASTQRVGAPKVSAPPGPSIADISKPKGAHFGTGIAGAFKGSIGGTAPQGLK
jgi:hypothetical protein